jgi:hypothetical protein
MVPFEQSGKTRQKPCSDCLNTHPRVLPCNSSVKEVIYDFEPEPCCLSKGDDPEPKFHHCEIEHGPDLSSSQNRIIDNLIAQGYAVHETVSTFYLAFPAWMRPPGSSFSGCVREEFQATLGEVGFLRFRFDVPGEVYLTLFLIHPEHQGRGHARKWFPKITNDLLKGEASSLLGRVMPSMYPAKAPMDIRRLSEFYRREAGFEILGGDWIRKTSLHGRPSVTAGHLSPKSEATETRRASDMATIS